MYNTAKVEYLLCGSLEDKEKAKTRSKWFVANMWKGVGGGMCRWGVSCVSGRHVSVTRGQGCLYL